VFSSIQVRFPFCTSGTEFESELDHLPSQFRLIFDNNPGKLHVGHNLWLNRANTGFSSMQILHSWEWVSNTRFLPNVMSK
jgi:hypothetical protein